MKKNTFLFLLSLTLLTCLSAEETEPVNSKVESEETEAKETDEVALLEKNPLLEQKSFPKEIKEPPPPIIPRNFKSSFLSVGLSTIPGLGHVYLGDLKTAGAILGSTGLGIGIASYPDLYEPLKFSSLLTVQNTWFYGFYAAYRDTRVYNHNIGYNYPMPMDRFSDLAWAPFQWSVIKKPEVWGGLLGAVAMGVVAGYLASPKDAEMNVYLSTKAFSPLVAFPVGIGEESFFRGYLQSQLSEYFTPWGGIALSTLAFSAVHLPNGALLPKEERWKYYSYGIPSITLSSFYMGWLTYKNRSLKESVALHGWYDFIVFLTASAASQSVMKGKPNFAVSFSF